jgi:acyl carrier protein
MGENEVKSALESWVVTNARDREVTSVPHDHDLFTGRVVDSLRFVDLVLYIEELSGRTLDLETLDLANLRTIDGIYHSFFD